MIIGRRLSKRAVVKGQAQMDVSVKGEELTQCWRPHRVSKVEVQSPQDDIQEGKRLMISELGKYNETEALLIGTDSTVS